ncbi:hypothetical protein ACS0TY_021883 [Phlomoides rotata]
MHAQGCDGSDLIDTPTSERKALPNLGLRGFQVIDDAKSQLEAICPGVVSCADILALAARDAVDLIGGPSWGVPTGRRDGRISLSSEVSNLPSPFDTVAIQRQKFTDKGLDVLMTMILSHLLNVRDGYAILESDQRLYGDSNTRRLVDNFAGAVRGLLGLRGKIDEIASSFGVHRRTVQYVWSAAKQQQIDEGLINFQNGKQDLHHRITTKVHIDAEMSKAIPFAKRSPLGD